MDSTHFRLHHIEAITNDFSEEQKIASGAHGQVYKAVYNGEEIAVKRLCPAQGFDDKEFLNEFRCHNKVFHKNVIRLIGYSYEIQFKPMECDGDLLFGKIKERILCFSYMHGGSLEKHIGDESCELDWPTCYKIIQGTCEGLNQLHNTHGNPIFHLDLKPSKILLDKSMNPKITGFGLSRLVVSTEEYQEEIVQRARAYSPPEYFDGGIISKKFDVFSLGTIIMEMMAGHMGYSRYSEVSPKEFIEIVSESWKVRLKTVSMYASDEIEILRVRRCAEIALRCVDKDREKRPSIEDIVHELDELEDEIKNLQSISKPPLPLQLLKDITDNFSDDRILGTGAFGVVYKGLLQTGEMVAVKKLSQEIPCSQKQFENEVNLLMKLKHQNIVRLVGYCYETQPLHTSHQGKSVFAWNTESSLCLECLPNGSLDKYISDASSGLDWHTRCKIIEGISYGLQYLHEYSDGPIVHLDLKPSNILLDGNMLPKITDFGLSRLFDQTQPWDTAMIIGTLGYMPPEFLRGIITPMSDIFSLGVIIMEVITGHRDYPYDIKKHSKDFIEHELQKWKTRLQKEMWYTSFETECQKIKRCIQIGLICVNPDRTKRPTMKKIIDALQGLESISWYTSNEGSNPHHLPLQLMKDITDNFSEERIIGRGGFGVVYEGLLNGEMVAVKKLLQAMPTSEQQFENEVDLLMKLKHPNVVGLVGYCYETKRLHTPHEGKSVFAWNTESLLCLECLPNGSLDRYISDASSGLDWHTRFKIIEGISSGLLYLHEQSNDPIIHVDLKPANILLDKFMRPKITDFGLSRLFDQNRTIQTTIASGTRGYMPPDHDRGKITPLWDIFSFGVIILEVITGHRDYPYPHDMDKCAKVFMEHELQKWRNILQNKQEYTSLETDCQQIKRCIQIGLICVNPERTERPTMKKIVEMLEGL